MSKREVEIGVKTKKLTYTDINTFHALPASEKPAMLLTCGISYGGDEEIQTSSGRIPHPDNLVVFLRENYNVLHHIVNKIAKKNKLDFRLSDTEVIDLPLVDLPDFEDRISVQVLPTSVVARVIKFILSHGGITLGHLFSRRFIYFPEFLTPTRPYRRLQHRSVNLERIEMFYKNKSNIELTKMHVAKTYRNIMRIDPGGTTYSPHCLTPPSVLLPAPWVLSYFGTAMTKPFKSTFCLELALGKWSSTTVRILDTSMTSPTPYRIYSLQNPTEIESKLIDILATTTLVNMILALLNPVWKVGLLSRLGKYGVMRILLFVRKLYVESKFDIKKLINALATLSLLAS